MNTHGFIIKKIKKFASWFKFELNLENMTDLLGEGGSLVNLTIQN